MFTEDLVKEVINEEISKLVSNSLLEKMIECLTSDSFDPGFKEKYTSKIINLVVDSVTWELKFRAMRKGMRSSEVYKSLLDLKVLDRVSVAFLDKVDEFIENQYKVNV